MPDANFFDLTDEDGNANFGDLFAPLDLPIVYTESTCVADLLLASLKEGYAAWI
jgi:hypothetical protein